MQFGNQNQWVTTSILDSEPNYEHVGVIESMEEKESKSGSKFEVVTVDGMLYSSWALQCADKKNPDFNVGDNVRIFAKQGNKSRFFIEHINIKSEVLAQ